MTEKKHSHTHRSRHYRPVNENNLVIVTLLNFVITVAEFAGGILSNSLALLSDALHNLSDTFATFIAYLAIVIGKKEPGTTKTSGYKRIEILAALVNAVVLITLSIFLIREAYIRLKDPEPVRSMIMLVVGMIGLLANVLGAVVLRKNSGRSTSIRAAYVHLIGDGISSLVVIAGGLLIQIFEIYWIDPLITMLICFYLIREAFVILKESVNFLMPPTPGGLNLYRVKQAVGQLPEVSNVHHLYARNMTGHQVHLEAHVELNSDLRLSELKFIRQKIKHLLHEDFHIHHVTLQFEYDADHDPRLIDPHHSSLQAKDYTEPVQPAEVKQSKDPGRINKVKE
jgi:cobalt-zinc-cadmium efflux system protein